MALEFGMCEYDNELCDRYENCDDCERCPDSEKEKEQCEGCNGWFKISELENINYRTLCDECYRFEEELDEAIDTLKSLKETFKELGFDIRDYLDNE